MIDLIWDLNEKQASTESESSNKMEVDNEEEASLNATTRNDIIIKAVTTLLTVIDELNMFNLVDDQKCNNLFKNWAKLFIKKTFQNRFKYNF
jgi:hypothetical protein